MSRDLALESGDSGGLGAAAQSALGVELQKVISRAAPECRAARAELVERDCAALETVSPLENEEKFTQHALALQQWPACFTRWLDATLGLEPPAVHEGAQKPR